MTEKTSPLQKALNLWAIVLIIWSIYRAKFNLPEWFDEFIAKPAIFIIPVYIYIAKIEKKNFFDSLWLNKKGILKNAAFGISIGFILIFSSLVANYLKHNSFTLPTGLASPTTMFYTIIFVAATAISEEILSRGFLLKRLYEDSNNVYKSSFFASILFFFLHIPILLTNSHLTGNILLLFMITNIILSLANSFIFLDRKNLIAPILIHAFYNLALMLYI